MIRAVLDTNVIISGIINPVGVPGRIMAALKADAFRLVTAARLLDENERVLRRLVERGAIRFTEEDIQAFLETMTDAAEILRGKLTIKRVVKDDPDDDIVLATALQARVDLIVSGDQHLQSLKSYESIPIVTPRQFFEMIRM